LIKLVHFAVSAPSEIAVCMSFQTRPLRIGDAHPLHDCHPPPRALESGTALRIFKTQAREIELSLKQVTIRIQRVELGVDAAAVAQIGQPETVLPESSRPNPDASSTSEV
jgi:hypothetical protein